MKELLDMFLTFARIGGFTFGGGYAMLPMLQKEVVNGRHWATDEELMSNFIELSFVSSAFAGIRACVCVLIGSAVVKLAKKSLVDKGAIAIAAVVFVLALFTSVSPALLVVVAGAIGIVLKGGKGEKK